MINLAIFDANDSTEVRNIISYFENPNNNLVFSKKELGSDGFISIFYNSFNDFFRVHSNILFLLNKSRKLLVAGYPNSPRFVYVSIFPIFGVIIPLIGLIRRIFNKSIKFHSIIFIRYKLYIKIENLTELVKRPTNFLFDKKIGVVGLIEFLNTNSINYVIPRFFENLPNLHRIGGDLDILINDNDYEQLRKFLVDNPGEIPIDVHTVNHPTPSTGLPYFPPTLASNMIKNNVKHISGASVPNNYFYLLSIIYHSLYHKGFDSGIPSYLKKDTNFSDNDYVGKISELLHLNSLKLTPITMENCNKLLSDSGYGLHNDTLEHLKRRNMWVNLSLSNFDPYFEIGLGVILMRGVVSLDSISKIQSYILKSNFDIIHSEKLSREDAEKAKNLLRGGNWHSEYDSDLGPRYIFVIRDPKCKKVLIKNSGVRFSRVRKLKLELRDTFKSIGKDRFHATDDTRQSIEYINVIKPDLIEKYNLNMNISVDSSVLDYLIRSRTNFSQRIKSFSKNIINRYVFK
jgi:hypothetical protein